MFSAGECWRTSGPGACEGRTPASLRSLWWAIFWRSIIFTGNDTRSTRRSRENTYPFVQRQPVRPNKTRGEKLFRQAVEVLLDPGVTAGRKLHRVARVLEIEAVRDFPRVGNAVIVAVRGG